MQLFLWQHEVVGVVAHYTMDCFHDLGCSI